MNRIYKITIFLSILLFLSCDKNIDKIDTNATKYFSEDKISKIEIGVNSPILDADGKAELQFKVKCKYKYKDKEYPILHDYIPMEKIDVYASTGEKFNIQKAFTTKNVGNIEFYCKLGNISSNVVSVTSVTPIDENYTPIVIPIQVYVQYNPTEKANADNITEENFQKILNRANKIFAGELVNAPSATNSKITFKLIRIIKKEATVESQDMVNFIYDNFMQDTDKYLTLWITNASQLVRRDNCIPMYTIGDPNNIPGLELKKTNSVDEINTFLTKEVDNASNSWSKGMKKSNVIKAKGIKLTQSDFFSMLVPRAGRATFEQVIGKAYGLLPTGESDEKTEKYINGDLDYCPDTFSYHRNLVTIEKVVFVPTDKQKEGMIRNFYDSFNIMDENSISNTISRDQIKRIRQVIKDCPFRQMQLK